LSVHEIRKGKIMDRRIKDTKEVYAQNTTKDGMNRGFRQAIYERGDTPRLGKVACNDQRQALSAQHAENSIAIGSAVQDETDRANRAKDQTGIDSPTKYHRIEDVNIHSGNNLDDELSVSIIEALHAEIEIRKKAVEEKLSTYRSELDTAEKEHQNTTELANAESDANQKWDDANQKKKKAIEAKSKLDSIGKKPAKTYTDSISTKSRQQSINATEYRVSKEKRDKFTLLLKIADEEWKKADKAWKDASTKAAGLRIDRIKSNRRMRDAKDNIKLLEKEYSKVMTRWKESEKDYKRVMANNDIKK
jgi:hypothetical protein